jgi:hypothetical protein
VTVALTDPIRPLNLHRLIAAASRAAVARLDGTDDQHVEHRLQAILQATDLGLLAMHREFPAWRHGAGRGFIDFLGVDSRHRIHIVETKIGADDMLILQGLDYWIWANAHREQLRRFFRLTKIDAIVIDYVVAPKGTTKDLVSPYSAAQVEALAGQVSWRFDATGWAEGRALKQLPLRTLPDGARRTDATPQRWAKRLDHHLDELAETPELAALLTPARHFVDPHDGLLPAAHAAYEQLATRGLLHSQLAHLRSSQAFALNLFAPLDDAALRLLWQYRLGYEVAEVNLAEFEYLDPHDTLGEATAASPHSTQVDVLLRARATDGRRLVALVEVKLSEDEFNPCSAYQSAHNPNVGTCRHDGPFGQRPRRLRPTRELRTRTSPPLRPTPPARRNRCHRDASRLLVPAKRQPDHAQHRAWRRAARPR